MVDGEGPIGGVARVDKYTMTSVGGPVPTNADRPNARQRAPVYQSRSPGLPTSSLPVACSPCGGRRGRPPPVVGEELEVRGKETRRRHAGRPALWRQHL
eukprot:7164693-Prymnesium_polylepis.1